MIFDDAFIEAIQLDNYRVKKYVPYGYNEQLLCESLDVERQCEFRLNFLQGKDFLQVSFGTLTSDETRIEASIFLKHVLHVLKETHPDYRLAALFDYDFRLPYEYIEDVEKYRKRLEPSFIPSIETEVIRHFQDFTYNNKPYSYVNGTYCMMFWGLDGIALARRFESLGIGKINVIMDTYRCEVEMNLTHPNDLEGYKRFVSGLDELGFDVKLWSKFPS